MYISVIYESQYQNNLKKEKNKEKQSQRFQPPFALRSEFFLKVRNTLEHTSRCTVTIHAGFVAMGEEGRSV